MDFYKNTDVVDGIRESLRMVRKFLDNLYDDKIKKPLYSS